MFTQEIPYGDLAPVKVIIEVATHNLLPPMPDDIPPAVARLVGACWSRRSARRPSAADLVPALEQILASEEGGEGEEPAASEPVAVPQSRLAFEDSATP
jgi:hypothetical protein